MLGGIFFVALLICLQLQYILPLCGLLQLTLQLIMKHLHNVMNFAIMTNIARIINYQIKPIDMDTCFG